MDVISFLLSSKVKFLICIADVCPLSAMSVRAIILKTKNA